MDTDDPAGRTNDPKLPSTTRMGCVTLRVADLDDAVAFYRDVVGLTLRERDGDGATLGTADRDLLDLRAAPDAPERGRREAGLFHVAFRVPSRAALGAALARIESRWELTGASDHVVSEALYCRDPEGNGVEVYRDTPPETWPREGSGVGIDSLPLDLADLADAAPEAGADARGGVPDGTDVGHVHLEATDLARAEATYADALGLDVTQRYGDSAVFLAAGDYHHHLGINVWNGRTSPKRPESRGLDAFEIVVPDAATLETAAERLAGVEGVAIEGEPADGTLAFVDPDGIRVEVVVD